MYAPTTTENSAILASNSSSYGESADVLSYSVKEGAVVMMGTFGNDINYDFLFW